MTISIEKWIKDILSNDESSTDKELIKLFIEEGNLTLKEAELWVTKRQYYLNNIVMDDGSIYKPTK